MDEWILNGRVLSADNPLSFEKADRDLCFNRIKPGLKIPEANMHFPGEDPAEYINSWNNGVRCVVMQGGQGDIKHWAFNDPVKREGKYKNHPPSPEEFKHGKRKKFQSGKQAIMIILSE